MRIFIQEGTPAADPSLIDSWENAVKFKKSGFDFIWIHHSQTQDTSRWQSKPRVRPFIVEHISCRNIAWLRIGAYKSLQSALAAAQKWAMGQP